MMCSTFLFRAPTVGAFVAALTAISACEVTSPPRAPELSIALGDQQIRFGWTAVQNANYYRLIEDPDGESRYRQVGGDLTSNYGLRLIDVHRNDWRAARYRVEACNSAGCTPSNEIRPLVAIAQIAPESESTASLSRTATQAIDGTHLAGDARREPRFSRTGIQSM